MNNQTAVDWLEDQIFRSSKFINIDLFQVIEQAKEMEKQQIMDANGVGFRDGCLWSEGEEIYFKSPEHYYVETYGINND
jgi:hypothetical protein